jgi:hypothetical protein
MDKKINQVDKVKMRVLVGCEESQVVTLAFRRRGHESYSCDLQECSGGQPQYHFQCDVYEVIDMGWDLIIMHPECKKVAVCGNGTYGRGKLKYAERVAAAKWIEKLWFNCLSVCDRVAFENPVGVLSTMTRMPKAQYIQPWQFGHPETKKTGLFLHGLPALVPTSDVSHIMNLLPDKEKHKIWYASPEPDRSKIRSKTYPGIAEAMAEQWEHSKQ